MQLSCINSKISNTVDNALTKDIQNEFRNLENILPGSSNSIDCQTVESNCDKTPVTKHALLLKPDENAAIYTKETWTEVVKKTLSKKLPNIPVRKAVLTKNGQGYLSFPDEKSRDMAAGNLQPIFTIEKKDNCQQLVLPKIKISGIESGSYTNTPSGLDELKQAILSKNETINSLVKEQKRSLMLSLSAQRSTEMKVML